MRLYIATPINARKEKSLQEKLRAARHRVELLKELLEEDERFVDYDMISTFDLPHGANLPEEAAISSCVFAVLTSELYTWTTDGRAPRAATSNTELQRFTANKSMNMIKCN